MAQRLDQVPIIEQSGRGESRDLALIVAAPHQYRLAVKALVLETRRLLEGHWSALQLKGHERGGTQLRQVLRVRREQIAFSGNVQTDRLRDFGRESFGEPAAADADRCIAPFYRR